MEMSNKSLALLLVAAIVISLGGTMISLNKLNQGYTGLATGKVELEVTQNASCNVDRNVSFGSSGKPTVTTVISTETTNAGTNFSDCTSGSFGCRGLEINNTGNVDLYINYTSNFNATGLLQGNYADTYFMTESKNGTVTGTEGGCRGGPTATWRVVNTSNWQLCANLTAIEAT